MTDHAQKRFELAIGIAHRLFPGVGGQLARLRPLLLASEVNPFQLGDPLANERQEQQPENHEAWNEGSDRKQWCDDRPHRNQHPSQQHRRKGGKEPEDAEQVGAPDGLALLCFGGPFWPPCSPVLQYTDLHDARHRHQQRGKHPAQIGDPSKHVGSLEVERRKPGIPQKERQGGQDQDHERWDVQAARAHEQQDQP